MINNQNQKESRNDSSPNSSQQPYQGLPKYEPNMYGAPRATTPVTEPGGFWVRFFATFIDGIIIGLVQGGLEMLCEFLGITHIPYFVFVITMFVGTAYYCSFYKDKGATPGKMLFGLKVVDFESGEYLDYGQTIKREFIGKTIGILTFLIGYIMAAFRSDKRALHDFIGGTQVVKSGE